MANHGKFLYVSLASMLCLSACGSGDAGVEAASEITPGKYEIKLQGQGIAAMFKGPGSGIKEGTKCLSSEQAGNLSGLMLDGLFGPELECENTFGENSQGIYNGKRTCITPENPRGSATITMDYTGKSTAQSFQFDVQTALSSQMPEGKSFDSKVGMSIYGKRIGDCGGQETETSSPTEQDDGSFDENSEAKEAAEAAADAAEYAADASGNADY